jgi:hypothetical protein
MSPRPATNATVICAAFAASVGIPTIAISFTVAPDRACPRREKLEAAIEVCGDRNRRARERQRRRVNPRRSNVGPIDRHEQVAYRLRRYVVYLSRQRYPLHRVCPEYRGAHDAFPVAP